MGNGDGCVVGTGVVGLTVGGGDGAGQGNEDGTGVVGAGDDVGFGLSVGAQVYFPGSDSQQGVSMALSSMLEAHVPLLFPLTIQASRSSQISQISCRTTRCRETTFLVGKALPGRILAHGLN